MKKNKKKGLGLNEALASEKTSAASDSPAKEVIDEGNQLTEEELKLKEAKAEYEKSQEEHARKVVEGIHKGYEEAKGLARDLSAKAAGTWITEKDLARVIRQEIGNVKRLLAHLDRFGMLECKIVGPAVMVKVNRRPEVALQKLLRDKGQMMDKIAQLDALLAIVHSECPKPEEAKAMEETNDTNDIMAAVK